MYRCTLFSLMVLTSFAPRAWGQELDSSQSAHHGLSLLYEHAAGVRLNSRPGYYSSLYLSWEIGPMIQLGDWGVGATLIGIAEEESERWGVRSRVRKWIGGKAQFDIGAGVLLGGASRGSYYYDHPYSHSHSQVVNRSYPGFTGLVGVGYRWVGINLEVYAIPATQYDYKSSYSSWQSWQSPERGFTDWGVTLGLHLSGLGAVVVTALEALALGVAWAAYGASN